MMSFLAPAALGCWGGGACVRRSQSSGAPVPTAKSKTKAPIGVTVDAGFPAIRQMNLKSLIVRLAASV